MCQMIYEIKRGPVKPRRRYIHLSGWKSSLCLGVGGDLQNYIGKAENMTLYEAQKGSSYCIKGVYVEPAVTRRLEALGLNDGTIVNVLNRKKAGALIIRVRGTRLALGKHISSNIEVGVHREENEHES